MKRTAVLIFLSGLFLVSAAQQRAVIPAALQNRKVLSPKYNVQPALPVKVLNPHTTGDRSVNDYLIGGTRYDNQSWGSMSNRLYLWPDSTISAAWNRGVKDSTGYPDLGTGYNYCTGFVIFLNWNLAPASRVETVRSGWPSVNPWMGNGEMILSHNESTSFVMNTRPSKGNGAWTQSLVPPAAPSGINSVMFPKAITSGSNHQYIHILAIAQPGYQGVSNAILYYRSSDGGATWDRPGVILPGMTASNGINYGADDYAWAAPRGDTLAFAVAGNWEDGFVMKSFDHGNTWNKTVFYPNPYKMTTVSSVVPPFWCLDGSTAVQLDHQGHAHVAAGRMRAACDGSGRYYYPFTDGLVYWNENMPAFDTIRLGSLDSLSLHQQLLGYVAADAAGDSIAGIPDYGVSMCSFPSVVIDNYNNILFLWSGVTVGNPDPSSLNYRHIWGVMGLPNGLRYPMRDFNEDFLYIFGEYAYPATAAKLDNGKIDMICQTSSQPGSSIMDPSIPVHDVEISFRQLDEIYFIPMGIPEKPAAGNKAGPLAPNPVTSQARVNVFLEKPGNVRILVTDLAGHQVMSSGNGWISAGAHALTLDCSRLSPGFYLVTVNIGEQQFTRRMVRE